MGTPARRALVKRAHPVRATRSTRREAPPDIDLATTRPGTPGGKFIRQFWLAIHRSQDLAKGRAKPIRIGSYPTQEYLGLIWAYFGEGDAPAFPPFPHRQAAGLIQVWNVEEVPCNYLQSFENSMDEVHVAFTHAPGGSHAKLAVDLPIISAEETDWGMFRLGKRATGKVRQTLHYAPNLTRVTVPPLAGMDGVGGWPEIYFNFTPIDDENHLWLITSHIEVAGEALDAYKKKRAEFEMTVASARPARVVARELMAGQHQYAAVAHPELAIVQDIAVQAGQGRIAPREGEHLGRSDAGIIQWRKILTRELRAFASGRKAKKWSPPPAEVKPTLGF